MKCPYCPNKPEMKKVTAGHDNWWECPACHKTVGKKEVKENDQSESNSG